VVTKAFNVQPNGNLNRGYKIGLLKEGGVHVVQVWTLFWWACSIFSPFIIFNIAT